MVVTIGKGPPLVCAAGGLPVICIDTTGVELYRGAICNCSSWSDWFNVFTAGGNCIAFGRETFGGGWLAGGCAADRDFGTLVLAV